MREQRVLWNADGTPNFGVPVADGETVISTAEPTPTNTPTPTPTITPNPNPEDINGDKVVNMADVIIVASYFNQQTTDINRKCDLNNDGVINMSDIIILAMKFNKVFN